MRKPTLPAIRTAKDAERQLKSFVARFEPKHQALIRAARKALRRRLPTAHELVYDNYNFFVIGYSPTERPSDAIVSIAAAANGVGLCFIRGATLRDPKNVLSGSGNQTRFLRLGSADVLARPEVEALLAAAVAQARAAMRPGGRGRLIIRSIRRSNGLVARREAGSGREFRECGIREFTKFTA